MRHPVAGSSEGSDGARDDRERNCTSLDQEKQAKKFINMK